MEIHLPRRTRSGESLFVCFFALVYYVRKASESEQHNLAGPKAHSLMKFGEFEPQKLHIRIQSTTQWQQQRRSRNMRLYLNPHLIVYLTFKLSLGSISSASYYICSGAPARRRRANGAPCLRKFDNPSISKILAVTWLSVRPYLRPSVRTPSPIP